MCVCKPLWMGGHHSVVINLIFITWEYGILNLPVLYELGGECELWSNDFSNKKLQRLARWTTCMHARTHAHAHTRTTAVMQ